MSCCQNQWYFKIAEYFGASGLELLLSVMAISLFGSFVHCIGMCGPIASARYSLRLMGADLTKSKLKHAIDYTYYIGKVLSYIVIITALYFAAFKVKDHATLKYILFACMMALAIYFALIAWNFNFFGVSSSKAITKAFCNLKLLNINWVSGFVLGFIPCGYLYAVLGMIALKAQNFGLALVATVIFGLGTVPGLFIVAFCGNNVLLRFRRIFNIFFKLSMVVNSLLMIKYALKFL